METLPHSKKPQSVVRDTVARAADIAPLAMDNTHREAIELMFFAYRDFIADSDAVLARHGFGRAHHRVLHFVGYHPGLSIADLLDILRVTKQSLARVLRELIDGDYIKQEIGVGDRRKRLLYLTARGLRLQGALMAPQTERFARVSAQICAEDLRVWKRVMNALITSPNAQYPPDAQ